MKIEWTKSAELDIEDIRNYIGRDSEYYANRFIGKIIEATGNLAGLFREPTFTPIPAWFC